MYLYVSLPLGLLGDPDPRVDVDLWKDSGVVVLVLRHGDVLLILSILFFHYLLWFTVVPTSRGTREYMRRSLKLVVSLKPFVRPS